MGDGPFMLLVRRWLAGGQAKLIKICVLYFRPIWVNQVRWGRHLGASFSRRRGAPWWLMIPAEHAPVCVRRFARSTADGGRTSSRVGWRACQSSPKSETRAPDQHVRFRTQTSARRRAPASGGRWYWREQRASGLAGCHEQRGPPGWRTAREFSQLARGASPAEVVASNPTRGGPCAIRRRRNVRGAQLGKLCGRRRPK